ncbi:DUF6318 family protein [Arthrobacter sp. 92]|uniref:DUF6318 family protein n=1 Tax=Arthrobacter sp. 92 TaxID=3418175 RepID=UPI003CFE3DEF
MTSRTWSSARPHGFIAALLAAGAVGLTACSGGTAPGAQATSPAPGPSTSASTTPSLTPTPAAVYKPADAKGKAQNVPVPVLPEAAKSQTKEGLEAFAKYWYSTLSYAYETGDTALVMAASGPNCVFCDGLREGVAAAWRDGRWVEGGTIDTPSVTVQLSPGVSHATVQVVQKEIGIHKPDGSLYQEATKATNTASQATAAFGGNGWIFTDLGLIR